MKGFFDYPQSAAVGRVLPKNRIYEHAGANTALKDLFVRDVRKIVWRYKLAPETIHLSATGSVGEIQVFALALKTGRVDEAVLRAIDKATPFPLIFELSHGGRHRTTAAWKRPGKACRTKWVTSEYFSTDTVDDTAARSPLPVACDLGELYNALLSGVMPQQVHVTGHETQDIQARVALIKALRARTHQVARLTARIIRDKPYHNIDRIYAELCTAKRELKRLSGAIVPPSLLAAMSLPFVIPRAVHARKLLMG